MEFREEFWIGFREVLERFLSRRMVWVFSVGRKIILLINESVD